ncbi:hypothetical protein Ancab_002269 [Ancistrocladus abbreviatus]
MGSRITGLRLLQDGRTDHSEGRFSLPTFLSTSEWKMSTLSQIITVRTRNLPNCTHLCLQTCHPGQCPAPKKCSKEVTVYYGCLKKVWLCQDVQAAYRKSGSNPKDVLKSQFGVGLLPCNLDCKTKIRVVESELQLCRAIVQEVIVCQYSLEAFDSVKLRFLLEFHMI